MFSFVVKYFGFLKSVPLLAHLFDSHFKFWALITNSEVLDCMDDVEAEVLSWKGTSASLHKYGGLQFNCNKKEIGHIHSNGILDIRFNRETKQQLLTDGKISDHHVFANSGWISLYVKKKEDAAYAIELLRMAYLKLQTSPQTPLQGRGALKAKWYIYRHVKVLSFGEDLGEAKQDLNSR